MFFRKQNFASHTFGKKNFWWGWGGGFLLCFLLGKDFVKVFYSICASHSFATKKNTKLVFFLCALCIFRKIICEGFSKCNAFIWDGKTMLFYAFLLLKFLLRFAIHLG
jgi:hypothetical protein